MFTTDFPQEREFNSLVYGQFSLQTEYFITPFYNTGSHVLSRNTEHM